jgi:cytochrome c-type biogenesis protein
LGVDISAFVAFGAGLLSFFSPCVVPLLPAYISFVTGATAEEILTRPPRLRAILPQIVLFCLGFSAVFVLLGLAATTAAHELLRLRPIARWVGGSVVLLFGIHLIGIVEFRFLQVERKLHLRERPAHALAAFVIGVAFAFGWTPCSGPVLASILAYAGTRETMAEGVLLLVLYSLGLAVPFLCMGFALGSCLRWLRKAQALARWASVVSGVLLIVLGLLLITDNFDLLYRLV